MAEPVFVASEATGSLPTDYEIHVEDGDAVIVEEANTMDWGALVSIGVNGGVRICLVGLKAAGAADLLREAADALEVADGRD